MIIIGLTGGIASGKSIVSGVLSRHGHAIVDMDVIARQVVSPGSRALRRIEAAFPEAFVGGVLDRRKLGQIVFRDRAARLCLNRIMYLPLVWALAKGLIGHYARGTPLVVVVAPLLYEFGLHRICNAVAVVGVRDREQLIERLQARDHVCRDEARDRIAAQMPPEEKQARADLVVQNSGDIAEAEARAEELAQAIAQIRGWPTRNAVLAACAGIGLAIATARLVAAAVR